MPMRARQACAHRVDVRRELRLLRDDDHVDVGDRVARCADHRDRAPQQFDTVRPLHTGSVSGKWRPISPARCGAKDGIGDRVTHRVRIGMAVQPLFERNRHAAEDQGTPGNEPMQVVSVADPD